MDIEKGQTMSALREARRWLRYQTRGRCTGQADCRNHWWVSWPHQGITFDSWRDYPVPGPHGLPDHET